MNFRNMTANPIEIPEIGITIHPNQDYPISSEDAYKADSLYTQMMDGSVKLVRGVTPLDNDLGVINIFGDKLCELSTRWLRIQDFRNRFTSQEQTDIANSNLPIVKKILLRFYSSSHIDLESAEVVSSVYYLADVLIIAASRVDEILAH